jgi:hypothetical protein
MDLSNKTEREIIEKLSKYPIEYLASCVTMSLIAMMDIPEEKNKLMSNIIEPTLLTKQQLIERLVRFNRIMNDACEKRKLIKS